MKKLILIVLISVSVYAQSNFMSFVNYVNQQPDLTSKQQKLDSFMVYHTNNGGFPVIEGNAAIFIYRGAGNSSTVAGDFTGWSATQSTAMTRIQTTDFFYYFRTFEMNARQDYKFVINGSNWILDPHNPNRVPGGFGPNSELAMPDYIQPWEVKYYPGVPQGTLLFDNITSVNTSSSFQLIIFLPPGYDQQSSERYPAVYFQDGSDYVNFAQSKLVLENGLDSGKIAKVIGVFVVPNNRNDEYAGGKRNQYSKFFAEELVPFIDNKYKTISEGSKRLVLGDSFGGNISALISWQYPEIFPNCGLHSSAFWPNNYEVFNLIVNAPKKNIKFFAVWGTYESLFTNMRTFRDSLLTKGYELYWRELPEGHSWGLWRANIMNMISFYFPGEPQSIYDHTKEEINFVLNQNYPNPFGMGVNSANSTISLSLMSYENVKVQVFDINGRLVNTVFNGNLSAGEHSFQISSENLSSGIYFYRIIAGNKSDVKRMVVVR
ncbi:MAG: T9SS type A sorting domain-containing protein [Ignavibacteriaceae bacterium]|nr:T9SS type A sorting domain-containing protein [Ignavibacteriaceae bacterium]